MLEIVVANLQLAGGATALADAVDEASVSVPRQDAAEAAAPEGRINQLIETKPGLRQQAAAIVILSRLARWKA